MKAKMIALWHHDQQGPAKKKATAKKKAGPAQTPAEKKAQGPTRKPGPTLAHADAVIINAFISINANRMEIQAKCKLADETNKTIGMVGVYLHTSTNFAQIGKTLIARCNDRSGMTKKEVVKARDEMLAAERFAD